MIVQGPGGKSQRGLQVMASAMRRAGIGEAASAASVSAA